MVELILDELDHKPDAVKFYCDSKVVLGYICNDSKRFFVYVHNRVHRIHQTTSPEQWRYVPSEQNPADLATRSVPASRLMDTMWFKEPNFLYKPPEPEVHKLFELIDPEMDEEVRLQASTFATHVEARRLTSERFQCFSTWNSLLRAIFLLIHQARSHRSGSMDTSQHTCRGWHRCRKPRTPEELAAAKRLILESVQRDTYPNEYAALRANKEVSSSSSILNLDPYISDGLLRREYVRSLGRRLKGKPYGINEQFPPLIMERRRILLPIYHNNRKNGKRARPLTTSDHPQRRNSTAGSLKDASSTEMNVEPWEDLQHFPREQLDKLCLDSFWSEVETIRQGSTEREAPDSCRRNSRQSEEGEQEEQWLQDAGLSPQIGQGEEGVEKVTLLSTLTRTQAAAVQRRIDSYTASKCVRNKTLPRDIRDFFNSQITQSQRKTLALDHRVREEDKKAEAVSVLEPQGGPQREEIFITDIAYCEQVAIWIKLPGKRSQQRKEDSTLPRVVCPQGRLGVTRIQDLSQQDMKKVRQLALIEMTALSDLLELDMKRHKTCKRKTPDSPLFGISLTSLLESDQKIKESTSIPLILQALLSFLEKKGIDSEGILRISGSQSRIKAVQQKLENTFYSGGFIWDDVSPHDAAALLKKFIRELPSPLLTAEHLNTFTAVRDIPELKQKLQVLNLLVLLLPEPNRNTLKAVLEFFSNVVSRERRNRMNLWAVSTVMAPNLFLHSAVLNRHMEGEERGLAEQAANILRLLIHYQDLLWTIPNFLMSQLRKLNENSHRRYQFYDKRIKNLLRKMHSDIKDKPDKNSIEPCRTVKIQLGDIHSGSMEVLLNTNSRTADLLILVHKELCSSDNGKALLRRNGSLTYPDCVVYEVGGNIGEHCLDPEAHLLDLYNNNPSGEWVIRLKPSRGR
ncbi:rho GTPase-activating protein 40 [Chanos chanos]|uniref:Rho GTPase-activating protein 40 n=1 Tax=Chanos chanos TaxID=29144 RepID=A0A6J2VUV7_CHACN|nr:rho GTPase-activating protein 40-like [Chanos chanos]